MATADRPTWQPMLGGLAIWVAVLVLSTFTSFIQRSPIHRVYGWSLLLIWDFGLGRGLTLLATRRWA